MVADEMDSRKSHDQLMLQVLKDELSEVRKGLVREDAEIKRLEALIIAEN